MLTRTVLSSARASGKQLALVTASRAQSKYTLPDLPYGYDALEPHISTQIMKLHHDGHHRTYVNTANTLEEQVSKASGAELEKVKKNLHFNKGGHVNHSLFWTGLAPSQQGGGEQPKGKLKEAIDNDFGGFDKLKEQWTAKALSIQGSGWAWLVLQNGKLALTTTANQDPIEKPDTAILGIDMWEHAFYLQHLNKKPPYLENIFKVLNWKEAEKRFSEAS